MRQSAVRKVRRRSKRLIAPSLSLKEDDIRVVEEGQPIENERPRGLRSLEEETVTNNRLRARSLLPGELAVQQIQERLAVPPTYKRRNEIPVNLKRDLREVKKLLGQNNLEAHLEAQRRLQRIGLLGMQRWNELHTMEEGRHNFSVISPERVNPFARSRMVLNALKRPHVKKGLTVGPGYGNDPFFYTEQNPRIKFFAVDPSMAALLAMESHAIEQGIDHRFEFRTEAINTFLREDPEAYDFDFAVSHSTLHYDTSEVSRQITYPSIALALKDGSDGQEPGNFCLAIKTCHSASANHKRHYRLADYKADDSQKIGDLFNPSVDKEEHVFRNYYLPSGIIHCLNPSFHIMEQDIVVVDGYDTTGDHEEFFCARLVPRRHEEILEQFPDLKRAA